MERSDTNRDARWTQEGGTATKPITSPNAGGPEFPKLRAATEKAAAKLVALPRNPIDLVWSDQPPRPAEPITAHALAHAGKSAAEKLEDIAAQLEKLGLLSARLLAVHMTQLEPDEIETLARTGVNIAHCPESNLKLASGFCPTARLEAAGVNIAIGTDGAASKNDLDLFGAMRIAALLGKAVASDPSVLPAARVLRMATLNGACALGLADQIGSLEPGKDADFVIWSGPPLDSRSVVLQTWIEGEKYFDRSLAPERATALAKERALLIAKAKRLLALAGVGGAGAEGDGGAFFRVALEHQFDGVDRHCLEEER